MKTTIYRFAFALCAALCVALPARAQEPGAYDQLVAPIALYPDALVAQVLAASTSPAQVAEAASWMRQNAALKGTELAEGVNAQPWDPSVKALTQFPSVLNNMEQNASWTSALGQAYASQPAAVMDAVQVMRRRAQATGHLSSSSQQIVTTQGDTIVIQPANPSVVYVPAYDPWLVYGAPLYPYPDWVAVPGIYYAGPGLYWGLGFEVGLFAGYGWGWHHWSFDWHRHALLHDQAAWVAHTPAFAQRAPAPEFRGAPPRPGGFEHRWTAPARPWHGGEFREGGGGFRGAERR
jgi:hypothetical protein